MSEWLKAAAAELEAYSERMAREEAQVETGRWGNDSEDVMAQSIRNQIEPERPRQSPLKFHAENFEAEVTEVPSVEWPITWQGVVVVSGARPRSLRVCDQMIHVLTDRGWKDLCVARQGGQDAFRAGLADAIALLYSVPGVRYADESTACHRAYEFR